jgi:hypothetical protein
MTVSIHVLRDSFVKPKGSPSPLEEVELAGVDVLFKRMNLRFSYFFDQPLNAAALKASLAEVCGVVGGGRWWRGLGWVDGCWWRGIWWMG